MQSNKISQNKLAKQLGIAQSTISDVLRGVRTLTKDHVILLAKFFNVGPGVFLGGPVDSAGQALAPRRQSEE
jgi:transcriptional regulator with XRE-family HTH domain